ncbi:hypothetical protein [Acidovorax sp.]
MGDLLHILLALLVLVVPIAAAWLALKLPDWKARRAHRGLR